MREFFRGILSRFSLIRGALLCLALVLGAASGRAQDALRSSLAGQAASEAKKKEIAEQKFNLEWGPVALRLQSGLPTEFNDNVKAARNNRVADISFRPNVSVFGFWPFSERNDISLTMGIGYQKYVRTTEFDSLFLAPNSNLEFDLFVDDFVFNFHDRFSYSQDVSMDPTSSGVGSLSRFENSSGVSATWDLNKAILTLGYDHAMFLPMEEQYADKGYSAELFNFSAGFTVSPITLAGLEVGGGMRNYEKKVYNNSQHVSIGPFVSLRLSQYSHFRLSAGYTAYFFDSGGATTNAVGSLNGFYAEMSFRQRINAMVAHTVSAGRSLQSGLFAQITDVMYVRHEAQWNVLHKISLTTWLSYEHAKQGGLVTEVSNRYGFGFGLARGLTQHLSTSLNYYFYLKRSQLSINDYLQNRLVLDLTYAF